MPSLHSGLPLPPASTVAAVPLFPSARRRRHPRQSLEHYIMRPLIGITSSVIARPAPQRSVYGISQAYSAAIERAGGIPLIIPPQTDPDAARAIYERLDGILFTGGGDIDPAAYGEGRLERCGPAEEQRDALELSLARVALQGEKPIFGICRGMQVLNVTCGGTLYQDINSQRPDAPAHPIGDYQGQRNTIGHRISIQPDSALARIMGATSHGVNTFHHQAVKWPGANVRSSPGRRMASPRAWSSRGIRTPSPCSSTPRILPILMRPVSSSSMRSFAPARIGPRAWQAEVKLLRLRRHKHRKQVSRGYQAQNTRAVALSAVAHCATSSRFTHSTVACARAAGSKMTVGMSASARSAESIHHGTPISAGALPRTAATS